MASNQSIVYNSEEFQSCISSYQESLSKLEECADSYFKAFDALSDSYSGSAAFAMFAKWISLGNSLRSSFARVRDAIDELGMVRDTIEDAEHKIETRAKNVNTGNKSPFGD